MSGAGVDDIKASFLYYECSSGINLEAFEIKSLLRVEVNVRYVEGWSMVLFRNNLEKVFQRARIGVNVTCLKQS